jgi:acyl carrier protein
MSNEVVVTRLAEIIRDVFAVPEVAISDTTTAEDINGWDSLSHVMLIVAIEKQFGIRLRRAMLYELSNVGALAELIEEVSGGRQHEGESPEAS